MTAARRVTEQLGSEGWGEVVGIEQDSHVEAVALGPAIHVRSADRVGNSADVRELIQFAAGRLLRTFGGAVSTEDPPSGPHAGLRWPLAIGGEHWHPA